MCVRVGTVLQGHAEGLSSQVRVHYMNKIITLEAHPFWGPTMIPSPRLLGIQSRIALPSIHWMSMMRFGGQHLGPQGF
jgi:hypothetical protein